MNATQAHVQHTKERVFGVNDFPLAGTLPPFADLSKVSFSVQPRGIRTREQLREFVERNFDEIFRRTLPAVYHSKEHAWEVVQELYPRLVEMLAANPEGIREPWAAIRTVTRNLAIDGFRRAERYRDVIGRARDAKQLAGVDNEVDREGELMTLAALVDDVLETLDERQARIITGIFLEGVLAKEIGKQLGLSESRVADLKRDALERMRPQVQARIERDCGDCFWSRGIAPREERLRIRD